MSEFQTGGIYSLGEPDGVGEEIARIAYERAKVLGANQDAKADAGKPILTMVPPQIMFEIEKVRAYGNKKYGDVNNWKNVSPDRYWEALIRHVFAAWEDFRRVDPESGLLHLAHIACNAAFLLQMIEWEKENADADGE